MPQLSRNKSSYAAWGFACFIVLAGCEQPANPVSERTIAEQIGEVELSVDYGDGREPKKIEAPCFPDSTVFSVLKSAEAQGQIVLDAAQFQGKAFVRSIDEVENQGASGQNWLYEVNGVVAKVGCSDFSVKPGDRIVWSMKQYSFD